MARLTPPDRADMWHLLVKLSELTDAVTERASKLEEHVKAWFPDATKAAYASHFRALYKPKVMRPKASKRSKRAAPPADTPDRPSLGELHGGPDGAFSTHHAHVSEGVEVAPRCHLEAVLAALWDHNGGPSMELS